MVIDETDNIQSTGLPVRLYILQKRISVIQELYFSENQYHNDLDSLTIFEKILRGRIVLEKDVNLVLESVGKLLNISSQILQQFHQQPSKETFSDYFQVASCFKILISQLVVYEQYINNFEKAKIGINRFADSTPLTSLLQQDQENRKLNLKQVIRLFTQPLFRIAQYICFIKTLLKYTLKGEEEEVQVLSEVLSKLEEMRPLAETQIEQTENYRRILNLQNSIEGYEDYVLPSLDRKLIRENPVKIYHNKEVKEYYAFLLNDILVYTQKKEPSVDQLNQTSTTTKQKSAKTWSYKGCIFLKKTILKDINENTWKNAIQLITAEQSTIENFTILLPTQQDKTGWFTDLELILTKNLDISTFSPPQPASSPQSINSVNVNSPKINQRNETAKGALLEVTKSKLNTRGTFGPRAKSGKIDKETVITATQPDSGSPVLGYDGPSPSSSPVFNSFLPPLVQAEITTFLDLWGCEESVSVTKLEQLLKAVSEIEGELSTERQTRVALEASVYELRDRLQDLQTRFIKVLTAHEAFVAEVSLVSAGLERKTDVAKIVPQSQPSIDSQETSVKVSQQGVKFAQLNSPRKKKRHTSDSELLKKVTTSTEETIQNKSTIVESTVNESNNLDIISKSMPIMHSMFESTDTEPHPASSPNSSSQASVSKVRIVEPGLSSPTRGTLNHNSGYQIGVSSASSFQHFGDEEGKLLKSGYLVKKGAKRKNWRSRWFVLRATGLSYMKSPSDTRPKGQIPLNGVQLTKSDRKPFCFTIGCSIRTYYIIAKSEDERTSWMEAISAAAYGVSFSKTTPS